MLALQGISERVFGGQPSVLGFLLELPSFSYQLASGTLGPSQCHGTDGRCLPWTQVVCPVLVKRRFSPLTLTFSFGRKGLDRRGSGQRDGVDAGTHDPHRAARCHRQLPGRGPAEVPCLEPHGGSNFLAGKRACPHACSVLWGLELGRDPQVTGFLPAMDTQLLFSTQGRRGRQDVGNYDQEER